MPRSHLIPSLPFQSLRSMGETAIKEMFENFRQSLYCRMVGTPDGELVKLKAKVELVNEVEGLVMSELDKTSET